jgi:hypothetical protein
MKIRMRLEHHIYLAGDPPARSIRMRENRSGRLWLFVSRSGGGSVLRAAFNWKQQAERSQRGEPQQQLQHRR